MYRLRGQGIALASWEHGIRADVTLDEPLRDDDIEDNLVWLDRPTQTPATESLK